MRAVPRVVFAWVLLASALVGSAAVRTATASPEGPAERKSVDPLRALASPNPRTRIAAVTELAGREDAAAEAALVDAVTDPARPEIRFLAAARLGAMTKRGAAATAALEAAWKDPDEAVRLAAGAGLGKLVAPAGAIDRTDVAGVCAPVLDIAPPDPPPAAPASLEPAALDGTDWVHRAPINVIGEGAVTILFVRKLADTGLSVAHAATANRFRERGADGAREAWKTSWSFADAILDPKGRLDTWVPPDRRSAVDAGARPESESVGLLGGRLVAPALRRAADGKWSCVVADRGPSVRSEQWTFRFQGDLAKGDSGSAEALREQPAPPANAPGERRSGPADTRRLDWVMHRSDDRADLWFHAPLRKGEELPKNVFPQRRIDPFQVEIDVAAGCGAVHGGAAGDGRTFLRIARPAPR